MPVDKAWLAPLNGNEAVAAADYTGDKKASVWLPNEKIAKAWQQYVKDTKVSDTTRPPAPFNLKSNNGHLTWDAEADFESGIAYFIIKRDGEQIARVPDKAGNPESRPVFQDMRNSDTPTLPLRKMEYTDENMTPGKTHVYEVTSVNTVGLESEILAR